MNDIDFSILRIKLHERIMKELGIYKKNSREAKLERRKLKNLHKRKRYYLAG